MTPGLDWPQGLKKRSSRSEKSSAIQLIEIKTMESLIDQISQCTKSMDVGSLSIVISGGTWLTLGSGDQRSVASHFIKSVVAIQESLKQGFKKHTNFVEACEIALNNLPTGPLENAADNSLRQLLFEHYLSEDYYSSAAKVIASTRMEDEPHSIYYFSPSDKCDGT
jgi:hypothetical protein